MDNRLIESANPHIKGTSQYPTTDQIGFIGPTSGGNKIRSEFTRLETSVLIDYLSDIGDISHKGMSQFKDIITEFSDGFNRTLVCTNTRMFDDLKDEFWQSFSFPVMVANRPMLHSQNIAHIGIQRHLFPCGFDYETHNHVRLGEIRNNMDRAEVLLRNADCIIIDLNSLRLGDNLGSKTSETTGLMIEELCMIAKYAGASINLKTIVLNGYDENQDIHGMMAKNVGLIMYYVLEGFTIRLREKNQSEQLQRYTVLPDHSSKELVFVEDQRSGRWWVELYSAGAEEEVKMACTRKDYEDACNNHISERLTSLLSMA